MSPRIITTHVYPPIPVRRFDWQAHYDGEEDENMDIGHFGLIIHSRRGETDTWDDMTARLKPEHFDMLGSVPEMALKP